MFLPPIFFAANHRQLLAITRLVAKGQHKCTMEKVKSVTPLIVESGMRSGTRTGQGDQAGFASSAAFTTGEFRLP